MSNPIILTGLRQIAEQFDTFIFDLWGTLHDGIAPYPGALECLERLNMTGKAVALLSNVPARRATVVERISEIGIPPHSYQVLRSSGTQVREALSGGDLATTVGRRFYYLGAGDLRDIVPDTVFEPARDMQAADFILCVGPAPNSHTLDDHGETLRAAAAQNLPMICANPDLSVMRGTEVFLCAGALATSYERDHGGTVLWYGKPYKSAFDDCLDELGTTDRAKTVMIGDTMHTDIVGGQGAGLSTVLIGGGIHAADLGLSSPGDQMSEDALNKLLAIGNVRPDAVIGYLAW